MVLLCGKACLLCLIINTAAFYGSVNCEVKNTGINHVNGEDGSVEGIDMPEFQSLGESEKHHNVEAQNNPELTKQEFVEVSPEIEIPIDVADDLKSENDENVASEVDGSPTYQFDSRGKQDVVGNVSHLDLNQIMKEIFHYDMNTNSQQSRVPVCPADVNDHANVNGSLTDRVNGTQKRHPKTKINCIGRTLSENETVSVRIINSTELLQRLSFKNESLGTCVVVMFYAPWCRFCAATAPVYNAMARAFPQLDTLAIDAVHFSSLNARFGTIAVPNILIFHNAKAVARFNHTERSFPVLKSFIKNVTGLQPNDSVIVEESDYEGPVPSTPTQGPDYLLWISWIFVVVVCGVMFSMSSSGQKLWTFVNSFGHEPHQHLD